MKFIFAGAFIIYTVQLQAQYYYKDIITTLENNRQINYFMKNNVQKVMATGFDPQGRTDPGFSEVQQWLPENTLRITTRSGPSDSSVIIQVFDSRSRLISSADSSNDLYSMTTYRYDDGGRITNIRNSILGNADSINETEEHQWEYTETGKPRKMYRILNNSDTLEYRFTQDENGNTADERSVKNGTEGELTYYYYDEKNRLTDIVRYNKKINRLMPDYLFEYNDNNQVIQKITTLSNLSLGYLLWRYAWNEKGLKTKEALYNKNKVMTGKIEYQYEFAR